MRSLATAVILAGSLLATTGCASSSGRVYVRSGPPPIRAEVVARSPGPGYVWVPGSYRYERGNYIWIGGTYERAPRGRSRWVPSHWERDRHGWYLVEGHWR